MAVPTGVAFLKTTLIDFPGRVATAVFLPGCNFRCPYCHNAALVAPSPRFEREPLAALGDFLAHMEKRKSLLSGVVISGGEPLLAGGPLLAGPAAFIAREARSRSLAVKLDTNGSFPERIAAVGADFVAIDLKSSPSEYARVAPLVPDAAERVLESIRLVRRSGAAYEIRITCAPGIAGSAQIKEIASVLAPGDDVVLQAFRPGGCLDPAWDSLAPFSDAEMRGLLEAVRIRAPRARLRAEPERPGRRGG